MHDALLTQSLLLVLASALAVGVFAAWGMPAVMGYLVAGVAIGPYGLDMIAAGEETRFLAELGLVFLMFMVGLEFSPSTLLAARYDVLLAGGLQVGATMAAVAGPLWLLGLDPRLCVLLGGAVAMSSTAIAGKQLAEQGELGTQHGRRAISILLFQDLATIPLLVLLDSWARQDSVTPLGLAGRLGLAALALAAAAVISRPVVRALFAGVVKSRSNDLFLLAALLVALGAAYLVHLAGLALPVGAFIAGMVIGESDFRHRVDDDIRPFRDVLVGLFFVTIGMSLDPRLILEHPATILAWMAVFLVGKPIVILGVCLLLGRSFATSVRIALILGHGGEFGLLLLTLAMTTGLMPPAIGQPVLIALALTMGLAPLIIQRNAIFGRLFDRRRRRMTADEAAIREATGGLDGHIVLCGCGRVGRLVATALEAAKLPHLLIEADHARFKEAQRLGHKVVHGDAGHHRILAAAGIANVKLVIITFDHRPVVERILAFARGRNPSIACIVSTNDDRDMADFVQAGASVVFPENLAAGLGLADQALLVSGLTQEEAGRLVTALRAELSPELRDRVGI
ncbi:cation:proton antiporter [Methylopila sp. 73B]|uniref:cation:proton antiporter domain-containing protein n=1 Tax=Methylopila sp. 73B TaxID=1120792 RepID=UPI00036CA9A1|nr:cation:proton antiporter [Methylopila sp. 73B]